MKIRQGIFDLLYNGQLQKYVVANRIFFTTSITDATWVRKLYIIISLRHFFSVTKLGLWELSVLYTRGKLNEKTITWKQNYVQRI
jgi:uncharacterized membrane protein